MKQISENIVEIVEDDYAGTPGFYFVDETEGLTGPYENPEKAQEELVRYAKEVLG